jgi:hypothetical protein
MTRSRVIFNQLGLLGPTSPPPIESLLMESGARIVRELLDGTEIAVRSDDGEPPVGASPARERPQL